MTKNKRAKYVIGILFIIALFIIVSYFAQENASFFQRYISNSFLSVVFYISILIVSAVIVPVDTFFLMPAATATWGVIPAALLSLMGWTLGSSLVFILCRKYGVFLIQKIIPLERIHKYEKLMPQENVFLGIIFLRLAIPIDVVSYAIGLLTKIRFMPFFLATLIGFAPLAFFLAYVGTLPVYIQIMAIAIFSLIVLIGFLSVRRRLAKKQAVNQKI